MAEPLVQEPVPPDAPPIRRSGRQATIFIFITVLLDMMALGMVAPVLPRLLSQFLRGDTSTTAAVYGLFLTVFALMQFFFSPMIGVARVMNFCFSSALLTAFSGSPFGHSTREVTVRPSLSLIVTWQG